jgi:hypothetical protein
VHVALRLQEQKGLHQHWVAQLCLHNSLLEGHNAIHRWWVPKQNVAPCIQWLWRFLLRTLSVLKGVMARTEALETHPQGH